jgi:hypothetical protein
LRSFSAANFSSRSFCNSCGRVAAPGAPGAPSYWPPDKLLNVMSKCQRKDHSIVYSQIWI